jgi:hypothetical protein
MTVMLALSEHGQADMSGNERQQIIAITNWRVLINTITYTLPQEDGGDEFGSVMIKIVVHAERAKTKQRVVGNFTCWASNIKPSGGGRKRAVSRAKGTLGTF